jgi:YggT family protein
LSQFGGAEEDRTPDLCSAIAALSQLSYGPEVAPFTEWGSALSSKPGTAGAGRYDPVALTTREGRCHLRLQPPPAAKASPLWLPLPIGTCLRRRRVSAKSALMIELLNFINLLIQLYIWIIIAGAIMSWLLAFNVINRHNQFVYQLWRGFNVLTEPALSRIRPWLPDLGGIDISPMVLILICWFIQIVILPNIAKLVV